jgi:hypothetical protein
MFWATITAPAMAPSGPRQGWAVQRM